MAQRDPNGWADLEAEQLEKLEEDDFEQFCFDLIQYEVYERHEDPVLDGPAKRRAPDGGRDILLTIKKPPTLSKGDYQRKHRAHPLTEDTVGRTAYSCKSGENWIDLALRDVKNRKEPGRTVEVLLEGGHFKLLINTVGALDGEVMRGGVEQTPHKHLAAAYWERLQKLKPDAEYPGARIEILDAHALSGFLQARKPEGGSVVRWADRLSLVPLLHGLDDWRVQHREDRDEPTFTDDDPRTKLRSELLAFVRSAPSSGKERAGWLVGPPGVGKTRLVIEAISSDPAIAQRMLVAWRPEEALDAIDAGRLLTRHPSVVLIVDDCPSTEVDHIASRFRAATPPQSEACLLVMTPASRHALKEAKLSPRWLLDALLPAAASSLAAGVLGSAADREEAHEIARLSEGYPWFATLLAREARAEGRPPHDLREATKWALASRWEAAHEPGLGALRLHRARCLLAASLTCRVDWAELSEAQRDEVARAVGLEPWEQVMDGAQTCVRRGILRRNYGWQYKYVTPLVLEREVIAWLFDPDDGHDPGGQTLTRHGQAYLSDFFEALSRLGLPQTVVTGIARAGLEDLARATAGWESLREAGLLGPRLLFIAAHAPAATARDLRHLIERSSLEDLRARVEERRGLMFALEALAARIDAFEDAEAALFRLAQAENESYANNATATWASLFFVELNVTYRSLEERMNLLARRMDEAHPSARSVALSGTQAVLTTRAFRRVIEPLDGAREAPASDEARGARLEAWALLAARFADPDPGVASQAKRVALEELRGAVRSGMGSEAMAIFAAHLDHFTGSERVKLRDALAAVRAYDASFLAFDGEYPRRLEELLAPTSFRQRLHQQVGAWGPAGQRKNHDALDLSLAREGLTADAPIQGELDWLVSDAAVRAHVFAYALGRCDERGVLLPGLRERARQWRRAWKARLVFARYLGGFAEAGRAAAADTILRDLRSHPEEAPLLALAIIDIGATDERLGWIEAALRANLLDDACILELGRRRHWLRDVSDEAIARLACVLVEGDAVTQAAAALDLLVDHIKDRPESLAALRSLLLRALERLAAERLDGMTDHYWELGAALLVAQGDAARVAALAVVALCRPLGSSDHAWKALHGAAEREPLAAWRAVAAALTERDESAEDLLLAFRFHRSSFAWPPEEVLSWVGRDARRGRMVASLVRPYGAEIQPILRELVRRFGPRSSVANEILACFHSTVGSVSSLAEHTAGQLDHARGWLADPDPDIRAFAARLVESLTRSHEENMAREEDRRRRWGT